MEVWKDVPGYSGKYIVSNLGRVASCFHGLVRRKTPKIMKGSPDKDGYLRLSLRKGNLNSYMSPKTEKVHRLVATAFLPNNTSFNIVNHRDGDVTNNSVDNLEWVSIAYNTLHGILLRKTQNGYS